MPGPMSDSYKGPDGGEDWFVVIWAPNGPLVMTRDDGSPVPPLALFSSFEEAEEAARNNRAACAYGSEAFQLGGGDSIV